MEIVSAAVAELRKSIGTKKKLRLPQGIRPVSIKSLCAHIRALIVGLGMLGGVRNDS